MEQKIKTIIVTHKDRFIRFGYDWFEKFCTKFNTTIVVVNNEELSPQEELVQDIVSIHPARVLLVVIVLHCSLPR